MPSAETRRVPYVNLPAQFEEERTELLARVEAILKSGNFVGGPAVEALERELAAYHDGGHVVLLNSGTDALILAMRALGIGPGDEVITPPNSFIASTASIIAVGATPVFADVLPDQNIDPAAVEAAITPRTKAIMPVHLTGRVCAMTTLTKIAERHGLGLIEDSAQAIGSTYSKRKSGTFGDFGCFSCHPLKNLNAAGDAGFLIARDPALAARVRRLRNHGMIDRDRVGEWGLVSRLDTLQAEILRLRLKNLPSVVARRRANAARYRDALAGLPLFMPPCAREEFNTFHTFVIQLDRRDEARSFLTARGIETAVHYPIPIHLQEAAAALGYKRGAFPVTEQQAGRILTLPVHQFLAPADIDHVAAALREFLT